MNHEAIVMGASAGGIAALNTILGGIPAFFSLPILLVQHVGPQGGRTLAACLEARTPLHVREAEEKEAIVPGTVFIAPGGYHLLVERDHTLSLSMDPKVQYARPSIDVLFESAADAYGGALVGVLLTGTGRDGAHGMTRIHLRGGLTVVQDPADAEAAEMPEAAIATGSILKVLPLPRIAPFLIELAGDGA
ncbi:MAG: chemotaxis protein CheB [Magnetococcales bacterium]|nr:chemotaxis protein CheB [Magnetococcales bacterium]